MTKGVEGSLVRSIGDEGGLQMLADLGELTLDRFLEDGLLKDAPIVGTLFGLVKMGNGVRDYLFAKKLAVFLVGVQKIDPGERKKFAEQIVRNPKQEKRVGTKVLMLLERHTDLTKSTLLGRLFSRYVAGDISFAQFGRLADALDRLMVEDLMVLVAVEKAQLKFGGVNPAISAILARVDGIDMPQTIEAEVVYQSLYGAGLLRLDSIPTVRDKNMGNLYSLTKIGEAMVEVLKDVDWSDV